MDTSPSLRAKLRRYVPLVAIAAILVGHSLQYNFVTDDAYISFVFSKNLATHGQLVFNPGSSPVEGYTNFLWTFLLGVLMMVGLAPEVMSLIFSAAFAIGTLYLAVIMVEYVGRGRSDWGGLAALLLALSSGFACWTSGGLETQMFTFWVTLALYSYVRADEQSRWYRWLGISLALAAMTRPEGLLVTVLVAGHHYLFNACRDRRFSPTKSELVAVAAFLILWAPWFGWRIWYYGHLFPNTYYVKASGDAVTGYASAMHANGRHYIVQWLTQSNIIYVSPIVIVGLVAAKVSSRRFLFGSLALLIGAVYMGYTVRVGGDFMGLHRFVMPLFVIAAIGLTLGLRAVSEWVQKRTGRALAPVLVVAVVGLFFQSQWILTANSAQHGHWAADNGIDTPAYLATYAHDRALIGRQMRECFYESDFSIFGGVGAKPYYANAKGIDVFGLVSEEIAHEVKRTRARAGHNKWGPNPLLYETYKPSFVFHCYSLHKRASHPTFNCSEGDQKFWHQRSYEKVTMHIPGLRERGEFYSFFVAGHRAESFKAECSGVVP